MNVSLIPRGTGVFARWLSRRVYGTPVQAAARAREHGLSWVGLVALGLVGDPVRERDHPISILADYAQAFREAGLEVWIWFFPLADDPERAADVAGRALRAARGRGLILDVEKPYRGRVAATRRLVAASLDQLGEDQGVAVTSYPLARYHRPLPWSELVVGTGMPQTYTIAPELARLAVEEWRERGHTSIVPVGPAYGPNSGTRLERYLERAYFDAGVPTVDGLGIWSWPQLSRAEWRVLASISARFPTPRGPLHGVSPTPPIPSVEANPRRSSLLEEN